jgi:hypothetical protein
MPADTVYLTRKSILAAKVEDTTGTAETLSAADGDYNVYDATFEDLTDSVDRPQMGSFLYGPSVPGARYGRITFSADLAGKGSSGQPDWATVFLLGCGAQQSSGVFTFDTAPDAQRTLTIAMQEAGVTRKLVGAAGTFSINYNAGQPVRVNFEFTGKLAADVDEAIYTPTFPTVIPPRFASNAVTFGAFTPRLSSLTLTLGNQVVMREDPADVTGIRSFAVANRNTTFTMDPELTSVSTRNWLSLINASTTEAMSIAVGTAANNIITTTASSVNYTLASSGDRNGLRIRSITGRVNSALVQTFT